MNRLWVPMSWVLTISQSSAASAPRQQGAPVASTSHSPNAKRCAIGKLPTPAKACDNSVCTACRQFTDMTLLVLMAALATLLPCTQATSSGGSSLTAQIAEQVNPAMPAGPSVAMTETAVAKLAKAPRNSAVDTPLARTSPGRWEGCSGCETCGIRRIPDLREAGHRGRSFIIGSLGGAMPIYYQSMDINYMPSGDGVGLDLQRLRVFDVLLRERSLTRAAKALDVTQRALSKTLARLRRLFDDPLFVRVSHRMEPTPKALALAKPVARVLEQMRALRNDHAVFDPQKSSRTFQFCVVDAGVIKLLPPLLKRVAIEAPHVRLRVVQLEGAHLESWLETGTVDFAMGSFPDLGKSIRRQYLWTEEYVSVVNRGH